MGLTRDIHPRPASIPEPHRLGSVQEHAVLDMIVNGGSEHPAFYITALANQIFGRVRMADRFDILMNDRPFVEVSSDIMGGRTDHFHAARMGLVIGLGALETRQETMVNVDAAATQISGKIVRKNLHIAGRSEEHTSELQSLMRNSY